MPRTGGMWSVRGFFQTLGEAMAKAKREQRKVSPPESSGLGPVADGCVRVVLTDINRINDQTVDVPVQDLSGNQLIHEGQSYIHVDEALGFWRYAPNK